MRVERATWGDAKFAKAHPTQILYRRQKSGAKDIDIHCSIARVLGRARLCRAEKDKRVQVNTSSTAPQSVALPAIRPRLERFKPRTPRAGWSESGPDRPRAKMRAGFLSGRTSGVPYDQSHSSRPAISPDRCRFACLQSRPNPQEFLFAESCDAACRVHSAIR